MYSVRYDSKPRLSKRRGHESTRLICDSQYRMILVVIRPPASIQLFLVFTLIVSAAGRYVTSEGSIVGTYKAEASCVTITLLMNEDHSFVQSVQTTSATLRNEQEDGKCRNRGKVSKQWTSTPF
jgi:hypothetical protein